MANAINVSFGYLKRNRTPILKQVAKWAIHLTFLIMLHTAVSKFVTVFISYSLGSAYFIYFECTLFLFMLPFFERECCKCRNRTQFFNCQAYFAQSWFTFYFIDCLLGTKWPQDKVGLKVQRLWEPVCSWMHSSLTRAFNTCPWCWKTHFQPTIRDFTFVFTHATESEQVWYTVHFYLIRLFYPRYS